MSYHSKILILWLSLLATATLQAQVVGGANTYDFLSLPFSARVTALGGNLITVKDDDLSLAYQNPAALNADMHHHLSLHQNVFFSGITYGQAAYAYHIDKVPITVYGGINYINYGKFLRTSNSGEAMGNFGASEYAIGGGVGYQASERLSLGANLRAVLSYLEGYNSMGFSSDWAAMYHDSSKNLTVSLVLRNLGSQFSTYGRNQNIQRLPFDAQLGFSHRLKYLPLRFSIIAHHLHRWNILYNDPALIEATVLGNTQPDSPQEKMKAGQVVDNIFRHLIFNAELLLGKKDVLRIRLGYDRMRQGELGVRGLRTIAGFSTGVGIRIYKFRIDYGLSAYHIAGLMHHFGISTNLSDF